MDENQNIEKAPVKRSIFGNYSRFVILTISTLCLTAVVSNSMVWTSDSQCRHVDVYL
jgi:hypothetical protein